MQQGQQLKPIRLDNPSSCHPVNSQFRVGVYIVYSGTQMPCVFADRPRIHGVPCVAHRCWQVGARIVVNLFVYVCRYIVLYTHTPEFVRRLLRALVSVHIGNRGWNACVVDVSTHKTLLDTPRIHRVHISSGSGVSPDIYIYTPHKHQHTEENSGVSPDFL